MNKFEAEWQQSISKFPMLDALHPRLLPLLKQFYRLGVCDALLVTNAFAKETSFMNWLELRKFVFEELEAFKAGD